VLSLKQPERKLHPPAALALGALLAVGAFGLIAYTVRARAKWEEAHAAFTQEPPAARAGTSAGDGGAEAADVALALSADAAPPKPLEPPAPIWRVAEMKGDPNVDLVEGIIGKRPFSTALIVTGVARAEMNRIVKAFLTVRSFERVGQKDTFLVAKEKKTGRVLAFEYAISPEEVWQAREASAGGELEGKKLDLIVERVRVAKGVLVEADLRASVEKAGLDDDLLQRLDDALEGHAELADVRPGALLRVVATEERIQGKFERYVDLDAIEYSPAAGAPPLRVYHQTGRAAGYYDAKGHQPYKGGWRTPVPLARISSRFNPRRVHPTLHVVMPHNGVDFAAPPGTPVYSAQAGSVVSAGDGGPCGNMVQVKHANGLVTAYCHLQRFAPGIHSGQRLEVRQLLGYVGQTGRATGPHLHFAVKRGETFVDPLALKLDGIRVLPVEQRDDFAKTRVELDGALDAVPLPSTAGIDAGGPFSADAGLEDTVMDEAP
jgi:murein DD-endopeptidase MepM/ murein hydrolase activator NlpD